MNQTTNALRRLFRPSLALALVAVLVAGVAGVARSQVVPGGDFDIEDDGGNLRSNTMFLRGRAGFGTNMQAFVLVNAATTEHDVDHDGFGTGADADTAFKSLVIAQVSPFVNVADPSRVIGPDNFVLIDFLNPLRRGFQNAVNVSVNVPAGTPAGIYRGEIQVRDTLTQPPGTPQTNPNGELLRVDKFFIEVEVLPNSGLGLVEANSATRLDSLVLRGRPGQTVQGVVRVANLGNVDLTNVRIEATELVATSGTGLAIPSERISFTPEQLTRVGIGDTSRVTVTVRIPNGILAGRYTGELIVQGEGVNAVRAPLTVIVTTPGDIVFADNPVRNGNDAVIIFNADAGSRWQMRIFDMENITAFGAEGVVFAGSAGTPPAIPATAGDEAVRFTWNLRNGRGENVASGMYYVVIEAIQDGRPRQLRGKLMVIR
jgi:hypothetical protein